MANVLHFDDQIEKVYKSFMMFPMERFFAFSMSAMALGITLAPDRGIAGFINHTFSNSTSGDFGLLLAMSGLALFCYHKDYNVVFISTLPLWMYMLLSLPYVLSVPGAPPTLVILSFSYLYVVNRVIHYHRATGYYGHSR